MAESNIGSEGAGVKGEVNATTKPPIPNPQSCAACPSWLQLGVHNCVKILIVGGLFYYLFEWEIRTIVQRWKDPSWSHGFLIPLFSLYFLNRRKSEILTVKHRPNYVGLVCLILGLCFYTFSLYVLRLGYPASIMMIVVLGSVVLLLGGWSLVKYTWLPFAYLVFAIPLPPWLYREVTIPMRILAARVAAFALNLVGGLEARVSGVVIDVVYKGVRIEPPLDVAEACSGMRLLMAFLALSVAMAYLRYRPIWQRLVLLASAVPIAIFCNIVRVTVTGFIYILKDPKYAQGIYHDILGLLMLPLAFGLYGFLAWFMSNLFVEDTQAVTRDVIVRKGV